MVVGGLFEAAKICYARNYMQFVKYLSEEPMYPLRGDRAERVIMQSLQTKKWFIEIDEFDQKERLLLNFGHTFGHAMEAASDFGLSHGIGVGLGMLISIEYAKHDRRLTAKGLERVNHLKAHIKELLRAGAKRLPMIDLKLAMDKFDHDKKHVPQSYRLIIPSGDGELVLTSVPKDDRARKHIVAAYERALGDVSLVFSSGKSASLNT
jgi:3-dehydroquinate synthase